jgi:hypothetical protein
LFGRLVVEHEQRGADEHADTAEAGDEEARRTQDIAIFSGGIV